MVRYFADICSPLMCILLILEQRMHNKYYNIVKEPDINCFRMVANKLKTRCCFIINNIYYYYFIFFLTYLTTLSLAQKCLHVTPNLIIIILFSVQLISVNLTQRSLTANRDKYIVQRENVEQCVQNQNN